MYRKALWVAWGFYTLLGIVAVLVAVLVPADTVLQASPVCFSVKQFGKECFMCGSTRSFIQAGSGNFKAAAGYNRFAVVLFIIFIVNFIIYATTIIKTFKNKHQ